MEFLGYWIKGDIGRAPQFVPAPVGVSDAREDFTIRALALEDKIKICEAYINNGRSKTGKKPPASLVALIAEQEALRGEITAADIMGQRRYKAHQLPRWRVWKRLRAYGYSLPGIAACWGFDHTTVLHGLKRLKSIEAQP